MVVATTSCGLLATPLYCLFPVQLDIDWDARLYHRKGSGTRLCGIDVFHEFKWLDVFPDRRTQFKNGQSLAKFVQTHCPPAMSDEGGKGAHVRYVRFSENRSAGRLMGVQLRPFCNGRSFVFRTLGGAGGVPNAGHRRHCPSGNPPRACGLARCSGQDLHVSRTVGDRHHGCRRRA